MRRYPHPSPSKSNSLIDQEEVWEHTSSQNLHVHGDFRVFAQPTICHQQKAASNMEGTSMTHENSSEAPSWFRQTNYKKISKW